jgi:glutathione S-transferase
MALEEKGVSYDLLPIDMGSDDHLKRHPHGKMPAFSHGDFNLYETSAIARYVDETFDGPRLQPIDVRERGRMNQWISAIMDYYYADMIHGFVLERLVAPTRGREPDEARIADVMPRIERQIAIVEQGLAGEDYLAGGDVSIADLFLAPIFFYVGISPEGERLFGGKSNIAGWKQRISARSSFQATMPPMPDQQAAE